MTEAVSVKDLQKQQDTLYKGHAKAKAAFYRAQEALNASKAKLTVFNNKYGRVLQMMKED